MKWPGGKRHWYHGTWKIIIHYFLLDKPAMATWEGWEKQNWLAQRPPANRHAWRARQRRRGGASRGGGPGSHRRSGSGVAKASGVYPKGFGGEKFAGEKFAGRSLGGEVWGGEACVVWVCGGCLGGESLCWWSTKTVVQSLEGSWEYPHLSRTFPGPFFSRQPWLPMGPGNVGSLDLVAPIRPKQPSSRPKMPYPDKGKY